MSVRVQCPVCLFHTLDSIGAYDICPVCFWEDDMTGRHSCKARSAPNKWLTVEQAQANYKEFGASSHDRLQHVREPLDIE